MPANAAFVRFILLASLTLVICTVTAGPLRADDEPFVCPANGGFTGIMETPTARIMTENTFRAGVSQIDPYRYYYVAVSPFKWLEISGKVTEILGVRAASVDTTFSRSYGNEKDKSLDIKLRLLKEGKWGPAIALAIMDPQGTRLYPSQSIIASKQLYPFDFTIGFGNGRFGKQPLPSSGETFKAEIFSDPKSWLRDGQFFGGVQMALTQKLILMAEYNPIRYRRQTSDPALRKYFQEKPSSKVNLGIRWKPLTWAEIDMTYQRGDTLGVNACVAFDIGQPLLPIYDRPYRENRAYKQNSLPWRLTEALHKSGFTDIGISEEGSDLWIQARNDRYYYTPRAITVIAGIVALIAPPDLHGIHIILTDNGVPLVHFTTVRSDITEWHEGRLTDNQFFLLAGMDTSMREIPAAQLAHRKYLGYGIKPSFETYLNDPSGYFKYRFGADGWVAWQPWQGMSFVVALEGYPVNNISSSTATLYDAVRSDIRLYKEKDVALGRLMFDQLYKMKNETYGRFAGGYLEIEYAGFDGELAKSFGDGRLLGGVGGSVVKKRDPGNAFVLKDGLNGRTYYTMFLNGRLNVPELDAFVDVKAGRFLGGDAGARVTMAKIIRGVTLYGWYSATDTSVFKDPANRGYHDKGIGITIPIRLFQGADSRTAYTYSVTPWTRDVAQDIYRYSGIFDYIGRAVKVLLDRDKSLLYK